jgi:hypothetical protein
MARELRGNFISPGARRYLAPHRWNLDPQLMFSLCPLYFVKMTFDPLAGDHLFLLAPLNAAVYGSLGLTLGYAWLAFRK